MEFALPDRTIRTFAISPRTQDQTTYWQNIRDVAKWSDTYGFTGILLFEGNDTYINPWLAAHASIVETSHLSPLVAVNPVYMHPFTAAKMVSSLALMYQRKVYLNMIAGTALSHLEALHKDLSHDDRYERLREYMHIVSALLDSPKPVTFVGRFYSVSNLQLQPSIPSSLLPEFFLAGQSDAAQSICRDLNAIGLQMLQPGIEKGLVHTRAIHFGVTTRQDDAEAWSVARQLFPESEEDQLVLDLSMSNTDSVWKRRMRLAADQPHLADTAYWLTPFRNFKADCPYVVGAHERIADMLVRLIEGGIDVFVLDIPAREEEFQHVRRAFDIAQDALLRRQGVRSRSAQC
jgi:alkanesulfonate monooxygenase